MSIIKYDIICSCIVQEVCGSSETGSDEGSDGDSLHSFHYSPKAVDIPSAERLAKRLYHLDGFKKSDVSRHLSKKYVSHFDILNSNSNRIRSF